MSSGSQSPSTFGVDTSAFDYDYGGEDYVQELVVRPTQTQAETKVRVHRHYTEVEMYALQQIPGKIRYTALFCPIDLISRKTLYLGIFTK